MKSILLMLTALFMVSYTFSQQDSSKIYFKKGSDEQAARRYLMASKYFDKSIQFDPKNVQAYIENGRVNLAMRRIDPALINFIKANELEPNNQVAISELTTLYFNNRQFQKAIDLAKQCKNSSQTERIVAMGNYYLEDYATAIIGLKKVLSKNPNDTEVVYTLGRSYIEIEDYRNAIIQYQKAVALDPTKYTWIYELALQLYNSEDFVNAKKYFLMAEAAGYPKSNDFYENIGFAYLNTGDLPNGLKNLNFVLSRKPNNRELLNDIAQAMYNTQHYEEALSYYQKLLELNAKDASSLYMAGMAFQKMGQREKGVAMCDEAIKIDPSLAKNRHKKDENM